VPPGKLSRNPRNIRARILNAHPCHNGRKWQVGPVAIAHEPTPGRRNSSLLGRIPLALHKLCNGSLQALGPVIIATMVAPRNCIAGFDVVTNDVATPSSVPDLARPFRENLELITDLARYSETLLSESAVRRKWRLDEDVWEALGADDELVRAIEEERARRVRS